MKPARIAIMYIETSNKGEFIRKCLQNKCTETTEELTLYWDISDAVCARVMDSPVI